MSTGALDRRQFLAGMIAAATASQFGMLDFARGSARPVTASPSSARRAQQASFTTVIKSILTC
jgi:hypothetical protein